jgi:hypothetical protein
MRSTWDDAAKRREAGGNGTFREEGGTADVDEMGKNTS